MKANILFVGPSLSSPISGGTLYNRYVVEELRKAQHSVTVLSAPDREEVDKNAFKRLVVDSLSLRHVPALRKKGYPQALSLLLHYLPSLVRTERACNFNELSKQERRALEGADSLIVTGAFMRDVVQSWTELRRPVHLIEPGFSFTRDLSFTRKSPRPDHPIRAVVLAPLTESKGVARFLEEIGTRCQESDRFEVIVAGRVGVEANYEKRLRDLVATNSSLAERVQFLGELCHEEALRLLENADYLVSCSSMESYGMALMEARQLGVCVLTLDRGNAREHARPGQCEVFPNEGELAQNFLLLVRSPRRKNDRTMSLCEPRPWSLVAKEFLDALQSVAS